MRVFEVCHITAGYRFPVIEDISFSVKRGEMVGILGRNGHGKTTLLRAITGDARRFSGEIRINGKDCTAVSTKKRAELLSVLPQGVQILEGIRVRELLKMGCYARHRVFQTDVEAERQRIERAAGRLGIEMLLEEDYAKLSQGQRQLVLLCRMLIQDTPVVLLDEPDAALDYSNRHMLFHTLSALVREDGKCGVMVLHDPEAALRWCSRILILDHGALLRDLSLAEAGEEEIGASLRLIYPGIQVRRHPFHAGYLCYLEEKAGAF